MIGIKELVQDLRGLQPKEKFFRVLITYLIKSGDIQLVYQENTFSEYLKTMGEDPNSSQYRYLIIRREEFMSTVEDIIMKQIRAR
jgi:hypothetical protein